MKSAEEARMAMKSFDPEKLPGFKKVGPAIESAIRDDKSSIYLNEACDSRLLAYLRTLGYKASVEWDRNEDVTVISWDEPLPFPDEQ